MHPESIRFLGRSAVFAPTVEVCLLPGVGSVLTSCRPPFSVHAIIFLDTTPQIRAGWMGLRRPG